jgi:hypothetical protein
MQEKRQAGLVARHRETSVNSSLFRRQLSRGNHNVVACLASWIDDARKYVNQKQIRSSASELEFKVRQILGAAWRDVRFNLLEDGPVLAT